MTVGVRLHQLQHKPRDKVDFFECGAWHLVDPAALFGAGRGAVGAVHADAALHRMLLHAAVDLEEIGREAGARG
jgi:hypothetical protein